MDINKMDLSLWKEIQDSFSKELGIPVMSFDKEGKEIVFSGELPFYLELVQSKRPDLLDKKNGCINIERPLVLYGKEIGKVMFGPVGFDGNIDLSHMAGEIGVEEEELKDASEEIKQISKENMPYYEKSASLFLGLIPKLAYQTQKQDKKIMELTALYRIIRKVNSTLDLEEVLKYIMEFLVNTLYASDCTVFVYDDEGEGKYCLNQGAERMTEIEKVVSKKAVEEKKTVIIKDINERFSLDVNEYYNSLISMPLKLKDEIIGSVNIYGRALHDLGEESLEFVSVIVDQVAIAISNAQRFQEVKELAVVDKLTGAYNRRYFMELLEREFQEKIDVENSLGLILLDIDNFGKYNNTHGHPKGDELLKGISRILKANVREKDVVGRYGGEEFIIMLRKIKPHEALEIAEKVKEAVADEPFYGRETQPGGKVTISAGLAITRASIPIKELVKESDEALYKAKNSGKNRVVQKIILGNGLKAEI